ncbi:MAG: Gfo/Idh/MocA family oxidoreductase [Rhizobiaceae bacterium]
MTQSATDPDRSYKIGVVGAGLIGRKHIDIAAAANALHAIIDPFEPGRELAQEKQCLWTPNLDEYLSSHKPDGVIIATPNQLHVAHGLACTRHKVPMLIEKPIADIPEQAEELVKQAAAAGVPILVGHHRRHNPLIKAAKSSIVEGKIGQIVSVHAQFWLRKPDDYFDVEWRRSKGAGPIFINLIHDIDLLRHLCGEVVQVQAMEANRTRGHEVEDSAAVLLKFDNGALGTVSVSDAIPAPWSWELTAKENPAYPATDANCYTIGGTMGALSIPDLTLWTQPQEQSWWAPIDHNNVPYDAADPLPLQFQHFLDVIDGKVEPLASGVEGLRTLRVISAIKAAGETGKAQTVASTKLA